MIKVNDHKTVEKVIFLMHYHKDWKVRKKNWKRYKKNLNNMFKLSLEELAMFSKRVKLAFYRDMATKNVTHGINKPKKFVFTPVKLVTKYSEEGDKNE